MRNGFEGEVGKRGSVVADRILDDVISGGWRIGDVLGTEPELLERYGVGRGVFREAVRLVEHQQVARMRRGPGGGLVVTEPTVDAIIDAAVLYLHRVGARLNDVLEARLVLEELATELATKRLREQDFSTLRAVVARDLEGRGADFRELHRELAAMSRNPALALFVEVLTRVMSLYLPDPARTGAATVIAAAHAHEHIVAAVMAGDDGRARRRMRAHLEAETAMLRRRRTTRQVLDPAELKLATDDTKRGEQLARTMLHDIMVERAAPGKSIGVERDLMAYYDVSRAVFREAVRLLEHHHVVAMRRGGGGGLFVVEPDVGAVTEVAAIYLARQGISSSAVAEMRAGVELAIVDRVIERFDERMRTEIDGALEREHEQGQAGHLERVHDLHTTLARLQGNPVLELVALVLVRVTRLYQDLELTAGERAEIALDVDRTHGGIASAIAAGDRELARHRMNRHVHRLVDYMK